MRTIRRVFYPVLRRFWEQTALLRVAAMQGFTTEDTESTERGTILDYYLPLCFLCSLWLILKPRKVRQSGDFLACQIGQKC
jgi:hypothetical protein